MRRHLLFLNIRDRWIFLSFLSILLLSGCASVTDQTGNLQDPGSSIVIMHLDAWYEDGEKAYLFGGVFPFDSYQIGVGSLQTGGQMISHPLSFLSEESKKEGWIAFNLKPGIYYLALREPAYALGNHEDFNAKHNYSTIIPWWKLEIYPDEPLVYAGEAYFQVKIDDNIPFVRAPGIILDGQPVIRTGDMDQLRNICKEHLPDKGQPVTRLLEKHEPGPLVFRSPYE